MRAIRVGDIYRLESPFDPKMDKRAASRLSYNLGTAIGCVALVVREPYHWDTAHTVTVIPSNRTYPVGILVEEVDVYDRKCGTFNFIPHSPFTVPVRRLGEYIGSLDSAEISKVTDAMGWLFCGKTGERPELYNGPFEVERPSREDCSIPELYDLTIDAAGVMHSDDRQMDGNVVHLRDQEFEKLLKRRDIGSCDISRSDIDIDEPEPIRIIDESKVEVEDNDTSQPDVGPEKKYPDSIIPVDTLEMVASGYNVNVEEMNHHSPRTWSVLTEDEIAEARESLSPVYFETVLEIYSRMTYADQVLYGVWLPTPVLRNIFDLSIYQAKALKRLCNIMERLSPEEYQSRLNEIPFDAEKLVKAPTSAVLQCTECPDIRPLKPYLTDKRMLSIPKDLQPLFLSVPEHIIRRGFSGKVNKFKSLYAQARETYSAG